MREQMLNYLDIKTKWHKVDYATLDDDVLRIIFVLYKDLDRRESSMKVLNNKIEELNKKLGEKEDIKALEDIYTTLEGFEDFYEKVSDLKDKIRNLI